MKRARPSVDLLSQQEAENFPEVNNIHTLEMKNIYWSLFRILTIAERKQIIIMFDNQLRTIYITWFRKKRKCQGSTQCEGLRDDKAKYNGWQTERERVKDKCQTCISGCSWEARANVKVSTRGKAALKSFCDQDERFMMWDWVYFDRTF